MIPGCFLGMAVEFVLGVGVWVGVDALIAWAVAGFDSVGGLGPCCPDGWLDFSVDGAG